MEEKEIAMPPLPDETSIDETSIDETSIDNTSVVNTSVEEVVEQQQVPKEEPKESSQQINFRNLREEKERLERELYEYKRMQQQKEQQPNPDDDIEINIGDDDLFEGKHYRKLQKQLKKQQEEFKRYQQQAMLTSTETKLKTQYSDFDKVVSVDNIKKLRELEPELSDTIASNQDIYTKAVSAYKMIKKLGIYVEDSFNNDRELAQRNSLKPRPLAAVSSQQGDSPLHKANMFAQGLTPELKSQLWKEMNEASKGH